MKTSNIRTATVLAASIFLASCGGGGGSTDQVPSSSPAPSATTPVKTSNDLFKTGVFLDAAVQGLSVVDQNGVTVTTGSMGEFQYLPDSTLTFYLGSLKLGTVVAKAETTPLDLFKTLDTADRRVINLLRFLQALDNNDDLTDGIQLNKQVLINAGSDLSKVTFDLDTSAFQTNASVIATLSKKRPGLVLPSILAAKTHFETTLSLTQSIGIFNGDLIFNGTKVSTKGLGGVMAAYAGNYKAADGKSYTVMLARDNATTGHITVYSKGPVTTGSGTLNMPIVIEDAGTLTTTSSEIHFTGVKGFTLNVKKENSSVIPGVSTLFALSNLNSATMCKNGLLSAQVPQGYGVAPRQYIGLTYIGNSGMRFAIKPIASFGDDEIIEGDLKLLSNSIEFSLPAGKLVMPRIDDFNSFYFNICS
jgi:hypothetical protein